MGACSFYHTIEGVSAGECFDRLVEEAHHEYGYDSYNGTISTCSMGKVIRVADVYSKAVEQKANKMIEADDYGRKWVATCLDLGRVGYEIVTVKKEAVKPQRKARFMTKYVIVGDYTDELSFHDTKTEAEKKAAELALKNPRIYYEVCKRPVDVDGGDDRISTFRVTREVKKNAPKTKKSNVSTREIRRYIFYGFAAE